MAFIALLCSVQKSLLPLQLKSQSGPSPLLAFGANIGTGFFVNETGDIVTAGHVVKACQLVRVAGDGFEAEPARVLSVDAEDDLALLHINLQPKSSLQIASGKWGHSEKAIWSGMRTNEFGEGTSIGFPGFSTSPVTQNIRLPTIIQTSDSMYFYRIADGLFMAGDSGSPILYNSRNVAGVLVRIDINKQHGLTAGLFVPAPVVAAFLQKGNVQLSFGKPEDPASAIVHIFCFTGLPEYFPIFGRQPK